MYSKKLLLIGWPLSYTISSKSAEPIPDNIDPSFCNPHCLG